MNSTANTGWQDYVVNTQNATRWVTKPVYTGLVYVAVPSSAILTPRDDAKDTKQQVLLSNAGTFVWPPLTIEFLRVMAQLREESPEAEFFSPSLQNYMVLPFMQYGTGKEYHAWRKRCLIALNKADSLLLCPFAGWQTSEGVQDEITECLIMNKKVYVDVHRPEYPAPWKTIPNENHEIAG